ncbi:hypothetical protein BDV29DRAFT_183756 [Aspergillus leporis]|uniref:Fungal-specific transcription factor domain-containing protein n=1 Tax=Aspergillus leporis TaxID=41062 RepID=A0A5N5WPC6_9EURO|nr:hypothetical protein BDV29DRAFT_183756 [Aspergillus leporis]
MKQFCLLINCATHKKQRLPVEILANIMTSVMYRLLHMQFKNGSIAEAIRPALLGFSSHVFLQWQGHWQPYLQFPIAYKDCLIALKSFDSVSSHVVLWLLMFSAVSIVRECDEKWIRSWLRVNIQLSDVKSWTATRDLMESFMWIGVVHISLGRMSSIQHCVNDPRLTPVQCLEHVIYQGGLLQSKSY